jgi:hypothetical protein
VQALPDPPRPAAIPNVEAVRIEDLRHMPEPWERRWRAEFRR